MAAAAAAEPYPSRLGVLQPAPVPFPHEGLLGPAAGALLRFGCSPSIFPVMGGPLCIADPRMLGFLSGPQNPPSPPCGSIKPTEGWHYPHHAVAPGLLEGGLPGVGNPSSSAPVRHKDPPSWGSGVRPRVFESPHGWCSWGPHGCTMRLNPFGLVCHCVPSSRYQSRDHWGHARRAIALWLQTRLCGRCSATALVPQRVGSHVAPACLHTVPNPGTMGPVTNQGTMGALQHSGCSPGAAARGQRLRWCCSTWAVTALQHALPGLWVSLPGSLGPLPVGWVGGPHGCTMRLTRFGLACRCQPPSRYQSRDCGGPAAGVLLHCGCSPGAAASGQSLICCMAHPITNQGWCCTVAAVLVQHVGSWPAGP